MRRQWLIVPTLGLLFAFGLLIGGIVLAAIPWTPELQSALIELIQNGYLTLSLLGLGCASIGVLLLSRFLSESRRGHLHYQMGQHALSVDESLIVSYVEAFLAKEFPSQESSCDVCVRGQDLSIRLELPPHPEAERPAIVAHIDAQFSRLLSQTIGYPGPFHLALRFAEEADA